MAKVFSLLGLMQKCELLTTDMQGDVAVQLNVIVGTVMTVELHREVARVGHMEVADCDAGIAHGVHSAAESWKGYEMSVYGDSHHFLRLTVEHPLHVRYDVTGADIVNPQEEGCAVLTRVQVCT
jgi:hypothetical protein